MRRWAAALVSVAALAAIAIALTLGARRTPGSGAGHHHTYVAGLYPVRPAHNGAGAATTPAASPEIGRLLPLELPIYCGGPRGNEVAFTFDDGPGVYTHYALKKLSQAHEHATFFVVGKSINSWPGWLPRELKLGAIGDHTYTHPDLVGLSLGDAISQLERTARMIHAQTGEQVELWRPPYGASDPQIETAASRLGLLEIRWSVDSRDWAGASWAQIIAIVEAGLRPGAIVLMHENHGQTIRALTTLLPYLHRHHLRSVTVPQLLASDPPSVAQLRRGLSGCGEPAGLLRPGGGG